MALLASRFQYRPGLWVGFLVSVLLHEAGHALVVRATGHRVLSVDVHGLGGLCRWQGDATPIARAMIAWGGVWAQMALFAGTAVVLLTAGTPTTLFWAELAGAFTTVNLWLMLLNLVPVPPLDGAEAWPLFGLLYRRAKRQRALEQRAAMLRVQTSAKLRLEVVEATRKESKAITAMDAIDDLDRGLTREVEAVLERARTIAAEEGEREVAQRSAKQGRDR